MLIVASYRNEGHAGEGLKIMKSSLNSIFRTIWSEALGAWIAVSEITKTKGKRSSSSLIRSIRPVGAELDTASDIGGRLKPIVFAVACCFALSAQANPLGGQVVNGQATFNNTGTTLTVTNTPGTIINWQGFSINSNEVAHFAQQSAASSVLNRVVTNNPSAILGTLSSNGRVFLVNPSGIFFGAGSTVDVAGLVATSLNLSNADFLAGRHNYTAVAGAQNVSNAGNINTQQNGQVYLIAPNVENTGIINAPNGEILLVAGHSVELVNDLDPNLRVNITAPAGDATNIGQLISSAGALGLFGTVVKNAGTVSADSATLQGGKIVFRSSQRTEVGGTVTATGTTGGTIEVLGSNEVRVAAGATLDASGTNGGGTILVGGDKQGANADVVNALATYVDAAATIRADATQYGDGGKVIVWADDVTHAHGSIFAQGGANAGNGGFVETSAHYLDVAGIHVDASAKHGDAGMWLLDPADVIIDAAIQSGGTLTSQGAWSTSATPSYISTGTIEAAINGGTSVTVTTANGALAGAGDISVNASIAKTLGGNATLTLLAENNINFASGAGFSSTSGAFNVVLHSDLDGSSVGTVTFAGINAFSLLGGRADLYYNPTSYATPTNYSGTFGATPFTAWMLVNNANQLQAMNTNPAGSYALGATFNASLTSTWNPDGLGGYFGFTPIGSSLTPFTGQFDGQGRTINGLYINRSGESYVGLFGFTNASTIKNVWLTNVNISGGSYVGGLVGWHQGTIVGGHNDTGIVVGAANGNSVGGLVGINYNFSSIDNSSAGSTVNGTNGVGGLVGTSQRSNISNCSASGNVTGTHFYAGGLVGDSYDSFIGTSIASGNVIGVSYVGGLLGRNGYSSNVSNSSAIGIVTGTQDVGGLVGFNAFSIDSSHATGNVSGTFNVGGLLGNNEWVSGTIFNVYTVGAISNSYASTGTVTGVTNVGGLVGRNTTTSNTINTSNASGNVTGNSSVGGLVGYSNGTINLSNASGSVAGSGTSITNLGGLVGLSSGGFGTIISNSFATGASVAGAGASNVGGLVGISYTDITNCYAAGVAVSGGNAIGGLVGSSSVTISGSYVSVGAVTGTSNVGGLVGNNSGSLVNSHYNINVVLINGANSVTLGGLYDDSIDNAQGIGQYSDWLIGKSLNILDYTVGSGGSSFGSGGTGIYTISNISNAAALQGLKDMLGFADNYLNTFTLTGNINLTALPGFYIPELAGTFDGASFTVSNLSLNILNSNLGLFGRNSGTVSNVVLVDANVTGGNNVGALAGWNQGTINSSSVSSTGGVAVSGADAVGGLVGNNAGSITSTSVDGSVGPVSVTGVNSVGGLVGSNSSFISTSFATGATVAGANNIGGLVGNNVYLGVISNSYVSTGAVSATVHNVGGLVGFENGGTRTNSYFNIDAVTTNGGNNVTVAGLYANQYNDWFANGPLNIANYSSSLVLQGDGSYGIGTLQGVKDMLGFADNPAAYNFSLTGSVGLVPGYYAPKLAGSFNGNNFTISNLSLTLPNSDMGLFGATSTTSLVSNLNLANARVNGYGSVGGLVGRNFGNIDTVSVAVNATNGISSVSGSAGGLVGSNNGGSYFTGTGTTFQQIFTGSISNSYVTGGTVSSGNNDVGGLVGYNNQGNIFFSGVTGTAVSGASHVGGLVGNNQGSSFVGSTGSLRGNISNSYVSNGSVTSTGTALASAIGGLVGLNVNGDISGGFVGNPTVNGGLASMVGGLVGNNRGGVNYVYQGPSLPSLDVYSGAITNSYVSGGTVSSAGNDVGGLVGNNFGALIDLAYVDTVSVTGGVNIGGLVGNDSGEGAGCCSANEMGVVRNSYALNTQVTGGSHIGGLIGRIGLSGTWTSGPVSYDAIFNSYVSGGTVTGNAVTSSANAIGGLVGYNSLGNISNSYVTNGTVVTGGLASDVGGLVGHNIGSGSSAIGYGLIMGSYVNGGTVSGNTSVGGLVGNNATTGFSGSGLVGSSHVLGTTVNGNWGVGGLVGNNAGGVFASYAGGVTVGATSGSATNVGGLVGTNSGTISQSYVNGGTVGSGMTTSAPILNVVGGLVGSNVGSIDTSYVTGGMVMGSWTVGGLVGTNSGTISQSYVNGGTVNGTSYVGGLIGFNDAIVSNSYVSGSTVSGSGSGGNVGGLVGFNSNVASISNSYVTGGSVASNATSSGYVGGLVGRNWGSITTSYASTGVVNPLPYTFGWGGLAGWNSGVIADSFWDIDVSGTATGIGTGTPTGAIGIYSSTPTINAFTQASYVGFNFTPGIGAWYMVDGNTRPFLRSEWTTNITNAHQLQLMGMDATTLSATYTLANNIDLALPLTAGGMWNIANGFVPVGDITTPFIGQFDGQNFNISNLKISGAVSQVGLFGVVEVGASISNVGLVTPQVSGSWSVGALVGGSHGAVTNSYVINGIISGTLSSGVGGLAGRNFGTINSSYVSGGTVSGGSFSAGGLVGRNSIGGTISQSYASSGLVTGGQGLPERWLELMMEPSLTVTGIPRLPRASE